MLRELFAHAAGVVQAKWRLWLLLVVIAVPGTLALFQKDTGWKHCFAEADQKFAGTVSYWGDFPRGWIILIVVLALTGWRLGKRNWQVAALAALLAGALAGAEVQTISSLTGRPRPSTDVADNWRRPTMDRNFKSFPSAHTTCAFAVATVLVLTLPALGVPSVLAAALVGWSRMALTAHYPSDVWVGMWIGIFNGLVFGLAARRMRLTDDKTPAP